ncbi:MAG: MFS transporter [Pseudomonadota bacterium]
MAQRLQTVGWSSGQIAVQIYRDVPSLLLLFFMTQILGISPALAGTAIFGPKLVVAVLADIGAGWVSDRLRERGSRARLLLAGALLSPVFLVLLFQLPSAATEMGRALYVALILTAYMIVFSSFSVPHLAIGTEVSDDRHQRTTAMAWRTAMSGLGLLVAASLAPILVGRFGGGADGYATMSLLLAAVCSITLVISWWGSRAIDQRGVASRSVDADTTAPSGEGSQWRSLFSNRAAVGLMTAFFSQLCAMGMAYATLAYLFTFNLAFAQPLETIGVMVLLISVMAIGIQPLWVSTARRIGRRYVYIIGLLGYTASLLVIALAPAQNAMWIYAGGLMMGVFQSACFTSAFSMLADVIEDDRLALGRSRAGMFSALFSIIDKTGFALGGTLLVGLLLESSGFVAGQTSQSADAMFGITLGFAVAPALLNVLSLALIWFVYPAERQTPQRVVA